MKKIISMLSMFLIVAAMFLQSCVSKKLDSEEIPDDSLVWENLTFAANDVGLMISSLTKIGDLTSYKTMEEVDDFYTAPCTFLDGDEIYVIRNFPEIFTEDIYEYIDKKIFPKEIEIYSISDLSQTSETIKLKGIDEKHIVYYSLSYDKTNKTYYIAGVEEINGEFIPNLYMFDSNGQFQKNIVLQLQNPDMFDMIAMGENIYYLRGQAQANGRSSSFIKYNLEENTTFAIDDSVSAIFENSGTIYYIKNEVTSSFDTKTILYEYNAENENKTVVSEIAKDVQILSAGFDETSNNLYLSDYDSLYVYSIKEKKLIKVMEVMQPSVKILQISNINMLLGIGQNQIAAYELQSSPVSIEGNERVLKICYLASQPGQAAENYSYPIKNMKFNGTLVRIEETYSASNFMEYMNTMAKKLLAGDDDFDLFIVHTSMHELFKDQYYGSFSAYPALANRFDLMLSGIKELCSIKGNLCLFPEYISFDMIQCNDALISGNYSIPETFDKMLSFKDEIKNSLVNSSSVFMSDYFNHALVVPWFTQYASNYMAGNINIDNKNLLRFLVSTSLSLLQDPSIYIGSDNVDSYIKIIKSSGYYEGIQNDGVSIYPLPKVDDSFKYNADASYIAINPNSKNKQLAANFLAYLNDFNAEMGSILYKNTTVDNHFHEHDDNLQDNAMSIELFEIYEKQLKECIRSYNNSDYMLLLNSQFDQLISGKISVDEMTDEIYNFLRLVRNE